MSFTSAADTRGVVGDAIIPLRAGVDDVSTHFVWLGRRFPYHCRLAVESAVVAMPGGHVTVHLFDDAADRHLDAVAALDRVRVVRRSPEEAFAGLPVTTASAMDVWGACPGPAARSNLARLSILFREGGVYLDTDVIVLRGLHDPAVHSTFVGSELVWSRNRRRIEHGLGPVDAVCSAPWAIGTALSRLDSALTHGRWKIADRRLGTAGRRRQVNNAVIGAPPDSPFVARALERAVTDVDPHIRFALGPALLDDIARASPELVHVLPPSRFYAVPPGQSFRFFDDHRLRLPADAQVMHYVASNHRNVLDSLDVDDPRFDHDSGPFWTEARRVRRELEARSSPGHPPIPDGSTG